MFKKKYPYWICGEDEILPFAKKLKPSHIVSLMDPFHVPELPQGQHLRLAMRDTNFETSGGPSEDHVRALIEFNRQIGNSAVILVHCQAGVSRSTAATMIMMADRYGVGELPQIVEWIWRIRPIADPNRRLIWLGDRDIGANGALVEACQELAGRFWRD